jgi:tetratricopeptide (TPR) repeat protein
VSAEFQNTAAPLHPEQWELFELLTEGSTELNAHVKAHVAAGCPSCGKHLADIRTLSKAREMKEEFDAFFDELPQDDAPADEREEFLLKFKKKSRPADRLGRLAHDGRQLAGDLVKAVSEGEGDGLEKAQKLLGKIESDPSRGYAYLYACQLAMPKVSSDPAMYVAFAKAIADATRSLPYLKDKGPAQPVCREQVVGEAALLESNALNYLGRSGESRETARTARKQFLEAGEDSFALALADYFEGSAASFEGDHRSSWRLLRAANSEFRLYAQENWVGRSEAALGTLLLNRNKNESAIHFFDAALKALHPVLDEAAYGYTLSNRAGSLMLLGRLDAAKAAYAKALGFARRLNMKVGVFQIRYGLASIELKKNRVARALQLFERIAVDARSDNLPQRVLTAELRAAECLGILGRTAEMLGRVGELRQSGAADAVNFDPAIRNLFSRFDEQSVSLELVAHVIEYLDAQDRGVQAAYKPFGMAANGS